MSFRVMHRRLAVAGLVTLTLTATSWYARAATFVVNSAADTTDGTCGPAVGECTLREAIENAVSTVGRDTITFDPSVFPFDGTSPIGLTSPLPVIADSAGTVVDGAGARVFIFNAGTATQGLVFASAPGQPLAKVTVANLAAGSFTGTAIHICGGEPPGCGEDVAGALVQNVVVNASIDGDGIRIEGRMLTKARVLDSVSVRNGGSGIRLFAEQSIVAARVQGCTSDGDGSDGGILLRAVESIVGGTVVDSVAVRSAGPGIAFSARDVIKAKVSNVISRDNVGTGILIRADHVITSPTISNGVASGNDAGGIGIFADTGTNTAVTLAGVVGDANMEGIDISGPVSGAKITAIAAITNTFNGIGLTGGGTTGATFSDVALAANGGDGMVARMTQTVLQRIHASGNAGAGVTFFEGGGGNTIKKSVADANDAAGIHLLDSSANTVQKNVALGNGSTDLVDDTSGCDANVWKANVFRTGSQPCVQ